LAFKVNGINLGCAITISAEDLSDAEEIFLAATLFSARAKATILSPKESLQENQGGWKCPSCGVLNEDASKPCSYCEMREATRLRLRKEKEREKEKESEKEAEEWSEEEQTMWTCPQCTFLNPLLCGSCQICGFLNYAEPIKLTALQNSWF